MADTLRMLIDFGMTDQGRHRLKKVYDFVGMVPDPIDFGENNT